MKAQMKAELVALVIALIMIPFAVILGAKIINSFHSGDPEDTTSIRSFEVLGDEIKDLLDEDGAFSFTDNVIIDLDSKFILVGFDAASDKILMEFRFQHGKELSKPLKCNNKACLCLIPGKDCKVSDPPDDCYDMDGAKCQTFDGNIEFVSLDLGLTELHSYGDIKQSDYNPLFNNNPKYKSEFNGFQESPDDFDNTIYNHLVLSVSSPSPSQNSLSGNKKGLLGMKPSQIYMDVIDRNTLKGNLQNDKVSIFLSFDPIELQLLSDALPDDDYVKFLKSKSLYDNCGTIAEGYETCIVDNVIVDSRKEFLSALKSIDPIQQSSLIENSGSDEEAMYHFLKYLEWAENPLLHENSEIIGLISQLSANAKEDTLKIVNKCKNCRITNPTCHLVDCSSSTNQEECTYVNSDNHAVDDLQKILAEAINSGSYELTKAINEINYYETKNDFSASLKVLLDYLVVDPSITSSNLNPELSMFKDALALKEKNSPSVDTKEKKQIDAYEYYEVMISGEKYLYIESIPVFEKITPEFQAIIDDPVKFNQVINDYKIDVKSLPSKIYELEQLKLIFPLLNDISAAANPSVGSPNAANPSQTVNSPSQTANNP
ncbi:hypothetical protein H6503_01775 [Candidatus Woesearchaeota archaeon]|nr:hypothetical protein [Candidatus Woesearchaeota archaeon]